MTPQTQPAQQLQPVIAALQAALDDDLIALALFGSQARGDAQPDSDWDLLLIADSLPVSPLRRSQYIHSFLPTDWRFRVNLLAYTPLEWFNHVTPLALDVALDGILLYDNSHNVFPARLSVLREQLAHLGLMRRQLGKGEWVWQWRNQPTQGWKLEWVA